MTTIHGIKNCDTVRKARRWLDQHHIDHTFRDFRAAPPSRDELNDWLDQCDWQQLLNKRSTSWKQLDEAQRAAVVDSAAAAELMATQPTLIKRPVLRHGRALYLGFKPEHYQAIFSGQAD